MAGSETCYVESKFGMGTFLRVMNFDKEHLKSFTEIWSIFDRIEKLCSRFTSDSQVSRINKLAGRERVHVDDELLTILKAAQEISLFTDGAFDATIGAVTALWPMSPGKAEIPCEQARQEAMSLVNYHWLDIDDKNVFLKKEKMKIDLGGIAKEFALHEAARKAAELGIHSAIIDAGGDVCTIGAKPSNRPWRIGIQHPRRMKTLLASVVLQNWDTVETSGDYRRFIKAGDKIYSHIFTARRKAVSDELISATLIYRRREQLLPINGTALIASGLAKSRGFLETLPDVESILVTSTMQVFITEGLKGYIHILPHRLRQQTFILNRRAC